MSSQLPFLFPERGESCLLDSGFWFLLQAVGLLLGVVRVYCWLVGLRRAGAHVFIFFDLSPVPADVWRDEVEPLCFRLSVGSCGKLHRIEVGLGGACVIGTICRFHVYTFVE